MSNVPLVRKAIVGASLAHNAPSSDTNTLVPDPNENHWTPAALERAGSTLKALNRMAKRPPIHILFEDIGFAASTHKGKLTINIIKFS